MGEAGRFTIKFKKKKREKKGKRRGVGWGWKAFLYPEEIVSYKALFKLIPTYSHVANINSVAFAVK